MLCCLPLAIVRVCPVAMRVREGANSAVSTSSGFTRLADNANERRS